MQTGSENASYDGRKKSSNAFRTIGEVATELGVPPHVLRFWESKFNQIKPHKRRGGHRYYRPADIDTIKEIKSLLYDKGFTIKGAQRHLKDVKKSDPTPDEDGQIDLMSAIAEAGNGEVSSPDNSKIKKAISELKELKDLLESNS